MAGRIIRGLIAAYAMFMGIALLLTLFLDAWARHGFGLAAHPDQPVSTDETLLMVTWLGATIFTGLRVFDQEVRGV